MEAILKCRGNSCSIRKLPFEFLRDAILEFRDCSSGIKLDSIIPAKFGNGLAEFRGCKNVPAAACACEYLLGNYAIMFVSWKFVADGFERLRK